MNNHQTGGTGLSDEDGIRPLVHQSSVIVPTEDAATRFGKAIKTSEILALVRAGLTRDDLVKLGIL